MKSGRELDAEVAERVMGWTRHPEQMHPTDNRTIGGVLYCPPGFPAQDWNARNVVPDFSESIEAAMQVIEKMRERAVLIQMNAIDGEWRVYISWRNERCEFGCAASLPEAICRAALAAIE